MFDKAAFKALLKEKGIRQAQLARMTGVPRNTINSWLHGVHNPKPDRIKLLADALGVKVEALTIKQAAEEATAASPKRQISFCPYCGENLAGFGE